MIDFNLVSNICEVVPISLFWAHNRLNELPEMCFVFAFNLTGNYGPSMAFLAHQSWHILKFWYTAGDPEQ